MQHVVLSQALLGMLRHTAQLRVAQLTLPSNLLKMNNDQGTEI